LEDHHPYSKRTVRFFNPTYPNWASEISHCIWFSPFWDYNFVLLFFPLFSVFPSIFPTPDLTDHIFHTYFPISNHLLPGKRVTLLWSIFLFHLLLAVTW
jgi:hypothetical protein